jgi:MFS family permease
MTRWALIGRPSFVQLWVSNAGAFLCLQILNVCGQWLIVSSTDSELTLGLFSLAQGAVSLGFGLYAGALTDRHSTLTILRLGRLVLAAMTSLLAIAVVTGTLALWHLVAGAAIVGGVLAASGPAGQRYLFQLVGKEQLVAATSLMTICLGIFQMTGPSLGGLLLATRSSFRTGYLVAACSAIASGLLLLGLPRGTRPRPPTDPEPTDTRREIVEGLRYSWRDPNLRRLLVFAVSPIFAAAFFVARPVIAKDVLGLDARGFGILAGTFGVGSIGGSVLLARFSKFRGETVLLASRLGFCIGMLCYALSTNVYIDVVIELGLGVCGAMFNASLLSTVQERTPEELHGRVLAIFYMVLSVMFLGYLIGGLLGDAIGMRHALMALSLPPLVVYLAMWWRGR